MLDARNYRQSHCGYWGLAGLAGSDGADVQQAAVSLGSRSRASERARIALAMINGAGLTVLTAAGALGEDAVRAAGLNARVVYSPVDVPMASSRAAMASTAVFAADMSTTTGADTTAAIELMVAAGARLVLFAGGDGTARDVAAGLKRAAASTPGLAVAALGIPAGVKMYSPVFAVSPTAAGNLADSWFAAEASGEPLPVREVEILDVDEAQLRQTRVEPRLYATMQVPYRKGRTQARKTATPVDEHAAVLAAARGAVFAMQSGIRYLLGPGGTMSEVARSLNVSKTPLGVDVVLDGKIVCQAASEQLLLEGISKGPAKAVVSVIGGQGFLLGRGNQQLSSRVIAALGEDPLLVVAPEQKLIDLEGRALLVDTGDAKIDAKLSGFA